jgi:hypothetical protein
MLGHYTVDLLKRNGDGGGGDWLRIDNEAVSSMQHEDVFERHNNEQEDDIYCPSRM